MKANRLMGVVLLLAACGGQPDTPTPASIPLAYTMPAQNPLTYASADTARVDIQVQPGMSMEQTMGQHSRVQLTFAPNPGTAGNLNVTASYIDFTAFMESSMMPRQEVGVDALQGEFVLSLTPEGDVEQVAGPELPPEVRQMAMSDNLFSDFFLTLPNRVVSAGETWTDTVSSSTETDGMASTNEAIITTTFRGDTTVNGRTLWVLDVVKNTSVLVEGNAQGMDMRNELSGTINEVSLWDPQRRVLVSSRSTGAMTGSVSVPAAGMEDIPLNVTNTRTIRLVEGDG